jgi:hypothetical protein
LEYFENKNIWNFSKRGAIIIHQKFGSENGGMHKLRKEGRKGSRNGK